MSTDSDKPSARNPTWSRDELIVTLDFYLRHSSSLSGKTSKEIIELSEFLNRLREQVGGSGDGKLRNVNGIYMKLMNFRRFDPDYSGAGLQRSEREDEVVWDLYSSRKEELRKLSDAIQSFVNLDNVDLVHEPVNVDEEDGEEGRLLTKIHRIRERNSHIIERKKRSVLKRPDELACEACGFDFSKAYGVHGEGFIECHYTKPVSEMRPGDRTRLQDLALVCSNCHRMIHRRRPWLSIGQLKSLINGIS